MEQQEELKDLRIINLEAEQIKRLIAVDIDFKGNLVQIASEENGEGKSTALDCIWWALEGAKNIQDKPIRKGSKEAHIRVTLGNNKEVKIIVTREFKLNKKGETTTKLILSNPDGSEYISHMGAQELLDTFKGALTFDPLKFATMDSKAQFDALRSFVPNLNFEAIAKANTDDYELRKTVNKDSKQARILADQIEVPDIINDGQIIDEDELTKDLENAATFNSDINERASNRKDLSDEANEKFEKSKQTTIDAINKINEIRKEAEFKINQIEFQSKEISIQLLKESESIKIKLSELKPLPELIDIRETSKKLTEARKINEAIKLASEKLGYSDLAEKLELKSEEITKRMEKREEDKRLAISNAKIPVNNISFGDDCVLLDGQPFEQASDAQRAVASMEIGIAQNPTLKLIIIRQGSLMSERTKQIVFDIAKRNNFLVIMETVGTSSKIGNIVIIEDGRVKKQREEL